MATADSSTLHSYTSTRKEQIQQEALGKAISGQSLANYPAIFQGFAEKGIPESEIKPRENVFTYEAWRALGRHVRRGEHGVKVATIRQVSKTDKNTGEKSTFSMPWTTTVFHITQTDADDQQDGGAE